MNRNSQATLISASVAALLTVAATGCTQQSSKTGTTTTTTTTTTSSAAPGTTTGPEITTGTTTTGTATDAALTPGTATDGVVATVPGTADVSAAGTATPAGTPDVVTKTLPDGQRQISINMNELPNETVICTVGGSPLRVSTYKSMLTLQQVQVSSGIGQDPATRARLLGEAAKRGITLSEGEKSRLLKTAKESQSKDAAGFQAFLKEKKLTEAQYEKEICDIGLAYKVSSVLLQQGLLPELVNREILVNAAKAGGFEKDAMNKYFLFKHSRTYPIMLQQTGLHQDALRDEIVKSELAKLQVEKLTKKLQVSEPEIKQFYNKNRQMYQHDERIRISSILILAPTTDMPPAITSIKTEIKKQNPKLSDAEVDARVQIVNKELEQRALVILGKAQQSKDFTKIANENTDDMQAKMRANGGDLGWVDKASLTPLVSDAVWDLKPGTVLPRLIKTEVGYQILKVTGHEKPGFLSYAEVKPVVVMQVQQMKTQQALTNWLAEKHRTLKIEYSPKFIALAGGSADRAK